MKRIIHMVVLSCKKATELIEKKSLFGLSWRERLQLRMHTGICGFCAIYQQQSILLDKVMRHQMTNINELRIVPDVKNEALKTRILRSLDEQAG